MFYLDYITKDDIKKHNPNWLEIPDYLYGILIAAGWSGKINALLNLINHEPNIDKIYLYAKYSYEVKIIQFLISKREYKCKLFKWF